jgi:hypothetical protein
VRDLIDILLVRRLMEKSELVSVRQACVEIFRLRNKHPWPPSITVLPEWPQLYQAELTKTPGFEPSDLELAARDVDTLIAQIDAATSMEN